MLRASAERKLPLPRLERWFQGEIVRPHEGGRRAAAVESLILPSRHLSPAERLGIYGSMYFARLHEALREDYPAVAKVAGHAVFERLARAYLARHPSRHYSLNFLGRKLPEFLEGPVRVPRRALLADVARVERAMSEAFDAQASPGLTPARMGLIPPAAWETGRIRMVESLRLLALSHRANAIVSACRKDRPLPTRERKRTWVAVYRKEWTVWRMDLTEPMHAVLSALSAGRPLGAALASGAGSFRGTPAELPAEVHRWFREWATAGLFAALERRAPSR